MMDDLKIATLFIRSQTAPTNLSRQSLTLAATGEAYNLAIRFQEIDPQAKVLASKSTPTLNWSTLVNQGQEQWSIAFLMPSGALVPSSKNQ